MEQKKLAKLEELSGADRRQSLAHLLNLDKLQALQEQMRVSRQDHEELAKAEKRHTLALLQARVPALAAQIDEVDHLLDIVRAHEALAGIEQHEEQQRQLLTREGEVRLQREQQAALQVRIEQVKLAREQLRDVVDARERVDRLSAQIDELRRQLDELHRRESEELPRLEQRITAIETLERELAVLEQIGRERTQADTRYQQLVQEIAEIDRRKGTTDALQAEIAQEEAAIGDEQALVEREAREAEARLAELSTQRDGLGELEGKLEQRAGLEQAQQRAVAQERARQELDAARADLAAVESTAGVAEGAYEDVRRRYVQANEIRALQQWLQAQRELDTLAPKETPAAETAVAEAERALAERRREWRGALLRALLPGLLALVALITSITLLAFGFWVAGTVALALTVVLAGLTTWFGLRARPRRTASIEAQSALERARQAHGEFQAQKVALAAVGGGETRMAEATRALQEVGAAVPGNTTEVEARLARLREAGGDASASAALRDAVETARHENEEARRNVLEAATRVRLLYEQAERSVVLEGTDEPAVQGNELEARLAELCGEIEAQATALGVEPRREPVRNEIRALDEAIRRERELLAAVPARQEALNTRRRYLQGRRGEWSELVAWLANHDRDAATTELAALEAEQARLEQAWREQQSLAEQGAACVGLPVESAAVAEARWQAISSRDELLRSLARRPALEEEQTRRLNEHEAALHAATAQWQTLLPLPEGIAAPDQQLPLPEELRTVQVALDVVLAALDEREVARRLSELDREDGQIARDLQVVAQTIEQLRRQVREWLRKEGIDAELSSGAITAAYPRFGEVGAGDRSELEQRKNTLRDQLTVAEHNRDELVGALELWGVALDVAEAEAAYTALKREHAEKTRAGEMVKTVSKRMIDKVLPSTERNMCLLLPLLTMDRYRDCRISPEYKLEIWDELANRYVGKSIFSGGTRDQFSLALRLAFALATLPEELGTTPGFIFLDEPLSSFDQQRSEALVALLTQGQIAANFSQIFIISHNRMFDRGAFTHKLVMEAGRVAEHDFDRQ